MSIATYMQRIETSLKVEVKLGSTVKKPHFVHYFERGSHILDCDYTRCAYMYLLMLWSMYQSIFVLFCITKNAKQISGNAAYIQNDIAVKLIEHGVCLCCCMQSIIKCYLLTHTLHYSTLSSTLNPVNCD